MTIKIAVNKTPYTDFVSASCTVSLESLANDFTFTASAVKLIPPFKYGDSVQVYVDDELKCTGIISKISGTDSDGSHTVTYSGRDLTSDLIDSNISDMGDISADSLTLKRLIELVISHIGSSLTVVDNLNPDPFNIAEDYIAPKVGQGALDFIRMFLSKRQAIMTSDGEGNVVISASTATDSGAILQRKNGAQINNILSQNWNIDNDKRFNKYIVRGQLDPLGLNFAGYISADTLTTQSGVVTDSDIPAGRQRVQVETQSYSNDELANRALWTKQLANAQAIRFNCTAKGHKNSAGDVWAENTLVQINSDPADITAKMLLVSATFNYADGSPTTTSLEFVQKNVYSIDAQLTASKKTGSQNNAYF